MADSGELIGEREGGGDWSRAEPGEMSIFWGLLRVPLEWEENRSTCGNRATCRPVPALVSGQAAIPVQGGSINFVKVTKESTENRLKWDVDFVDFLEK